MKREDLSTMADVQIYFTNRIAEIVQSKGRNIMGWNEILGDDLHGFLKDGQTARNAKLDTDTVVHFWSGSPELAKRAIRKGHRIVNSWNVYTYLDYSYASIPLAKAYAFDPVLDGLTPEEQSSIIGSGCQMWGEWIPTVERMEHQIFPRLAAYAEVGWTWLDRKDFASFKKRLNDQLKRWELQGIAYARNQVNVLTRQDFFNVPTMDRWTAAQTPANWETRTFQTANRIQDPGTYEVVFLYSSGVHALQIRNAELLRNGDVIDTDAHEAFSGNSLNGIVYSFELPEGTPAGTYTIRAEVKGSGGTDSNGEVKIRKAD
jgi:hexosaminidase